MWTSQDAGQFVTSAIRLGSRGDSFYEYLLYVISCLRLNEPQLIRHIGNSICRLYVLAAFFLVYRLTLRLESNRDGVP